MTKNATDFYMPEGLKMATFVAVSGCGWARFKNKLLRRIVNRFRGRLVFKAHRLLHHSTLGSRVIKRKREEEAYKGKTAASAQSFQSARVGSL